MPELPEVETIKETLLPNIKGKTINAIDILLARVIKYPDEKTFAQELVNAKIKDVLRRGKYLVILLSTGKKLVIHLRLTGALIYSKDMDIPKYTCIKFVLSDNSYLYYTDVRTLGTLYLVDENSEKFIKGLVTLGPEPMETVLEENYFKAGILKRTAPIKSVLLDQTFIAGLGNIYVDEALFIANIMPGRKASTLKENEIKQLYKSVIAVIKQGIKNHGTTFRDYKDGEGNKGDNQNHLFVYGKSKTPCQKCQTVLEYTKIGGRGTTFCPKCQI